MNKSEPTHDFRDVNELTPTQADLMNLLVRETPVGFGLMEYAIIERRLILDAAKYLDHASTRPTRVMLSIIRDKLYVKTNFDAINKWRGRG